MALARDTTSTSSTTGTSLTWSHTCTGSNLILFVGGRTYADSSDAITGITYNGVSMTRIAFLNSSGPAIYLYYLINPATGANNITVTNGLSSRLLNFGAVSYTGAKQSSQPDNSNTNTTTGTSLSTSVTTVADNCWLVAIAVDNNGTSQTAGANTTIIQAFSGTDQDMLLDSNAAKTPAGSYSLAFSWTGSQPAAMIIASIAPAVSATAHNLPLLGVGA